MKQIGAFLVFIIAGYFAFQQLRPKPVAPPPTPPPPAILLEPLPVITEEEQVKVINSTNDQDPDVRWEALVFLEKMKAPQAYPLLFQKLRIDPELNLKIKIINLLGTRSHPEIPEHLLEALKDHNPPVRIKALQALELLGDYSTASAITEILRDQDEAVRVQALKTLNSLQDKREAEIAAEKLRQEQLRRQAEQEAARKKGKGWF
ncbi:MAG: hypothetical protein A3J74_03570 [Elusimicrobia bacterium RIFCSPHIGHO2_02_FULL_57_9]|nr:MAG: hypothetical protein A3J74_03570 [Elusimicrobia bacterium RIFCSPHIGHO2_02_FULL_57_9]